MNREQIINTLEHHLGELQTRFGVRELALFGSVARNGAVQGSDVDLVVDYGEPPTFRQYTGALLYLEDVLGCKVDLVTRSGLKPDLKPVIEQDLVPIQNAA